MPHTIFSTYLAPATLTQTLTVTLTLTLTKLSVVEQDVTGAKSLGYSALGHDVLGQDVGHHGKQPMRLRKLTHIVKRGKVAICLKKLQTYNTVVVAVIPDSRS